MKKVHKIMSKIPIILKQCISIHKVSTKKINTNVIKTENGIIAPQPHTTN